MRGFHPLILVSTNFTIPITIPIKRKWNNGIKQKFFFHLLRSKQKIMSKHPRHPNQDRANWVHNNPFRTHRRQAINPLHISIPFKKVSLCWSTHIATLLQSCRPIVQLKNKCSVSSLSCWKTGHNIKSIS